MTLFIHGISSWIGYYLTQYMQQTYPKIKIAGTYCSNKPKYKTGKIQLFSINNNQDCPEILNNMSLKYFVNLSRGEEEHDFLAHKKLIEICNKKNIHYYYASSSNACDKNNEQVHYEDELPESQSEYGKFKARCENFLFQKSNNYAIFRFAATHGWSSYRIVRTEAFLKQLAGNETIKIPIGIIQNRTPINALTGMMGDIIMMNGQGVFHLGTFDHSEEINFLKQIAINFGYPASRIVEGDYNPFNLVTVPDKLYHYFNDKWKISETYTHQCILNTKELQKYKFTGNLRNQA